MTDPRYGTEKTLQLYYDSTDKNISNSLLTCFSFNSWSSAPTEKRYPALYLNYTYQEARKLGLEAAVPPTQVWLPVNDPFLEESPIKGSHAFITLM